MAQTETTPATTTSTSEKTPRITVTITDPGHGSRDFLDRTAQFVDTYHPYPWPALFLDFCWVMEVHEYGDLVALMWFHWLKPDHSIEVHACARPDVRGRWLMRTVLDHLFAMPDYAGADVMVAQVTGDKICQLWQRLGFEIIGPFAVLDIRENEVTHGRI